MPARYMLSSRVCLSVRPSQASIVSKVLDKSSLFWHGGFFPPIQHCAVRKCGYLQKLRYFLLRTLSPTPELENFAAASRSRCQQHSSSSSSTTVELVDDTYAVAPINESWLFTTSRSTVTPLLRFVVDLLYNLFVQLTRF